MLLYRCAVEWVDLDLGKFERKPARDRGVALLWGAHRAANSFCQCGLCARWLGIAVGGADWPPL